MFVLPYLKSALKTKQNTQKQAKRKKECLIVDDDYLILILYNILYTNLSLVLSNLQKIQQDMNAMSSGLRPWP